MKRFLFFKGYKDQMEFPDMKNLIPVSLKGKSEVLFGNLESIHSFHNQFFLPALESSSSIESVAVCFTDNVIIVQFIISHSYLFLIIFFNVFRGRNFFSFILTIVLI